MTNNFQKIFAPDPNLPYSWAMRKRFETLRAALSAKIRSWMVVVFLLATAGLVQAAQPTAYTRQANFSDHSSNLPSTPHIGTNMDSEFNAVKTTLDGVLANLVLIQADDGGIKNAIVDADTFAANALALVSGNFTAKGDWATATAYVIGDLVEDASVTYVAHTAHTSTGGSIDTTKFVAWNPTGAASAITFSATGNISSTDVQAAIAEVDTEKLATGVLLDDKGTAIVSATATDLFDADSNFVDITGTVTITSFTGTALDHVWVKFTGALILTHNATTLILPTGANITTAVGDMAHFAVDTSGNVTCLDFIPISGLPISFIDEDSMATDSAILVPSQQSVKAYVDAQVLAPGLVLLATASASASATVSFTSLIDSTYEEYQIHVSDFIAASDGEDVWVRTSTDSITFDSGASDYTWGMGGDSSNSALNSVAGDSADSEIHLTQDGTNENLGNGAGETFNGIVYLWNPAGTNATQISAEVIYIDEASRSMRNSTGGHRNSAADVTGIRFLMSSGNITSGEFKMYGVDKAL